MNKKLKKEELEAANAAFKAYEAAIGDNLEAGADDIENIAAGLDAAFKAYWANIEEQQKNNNLK